MGSSKILIRFLKEKRLSQSELARKAGFRRSQVSSWITGRYDLSNSTIYKISEVYPEFEDYLNDVKTNENTEGGNRKKQEELEALAEAREKIIYLLNEKIENLESTLRIVRESIGSEDADVRLKTKK